MTALYQSLPTSSTVAGKVIEITWVIFQLAMFDYRGGNLSYTDYTSIISHVIMVPNSWAKTNPQEQKLHDES